MGKGFMQALKIFFMQAIKKKIVYTSIFFRLYKPLACMNHTWKNNNFQASFA
jgi:hypothetical protein